MNSEDQVGWDPLGCNHEDDGNLEMRGLLQNKPIRLRPNGATANTFTRAFKYLLVRALAILITIFIGVFITVVIANRGGQIDAIVAQEVNIKVMRNLPFQYSFYRAPTPEQQAIIDQLRAQYSAAAGLTLPFIPRHIVWTFRALKLDLGNNVKITSAPGSVYPSHRARDIILTDLPHSLLLIGTSFLLLFAIGIPVALFLFRNHGSRIDRLFSLLAPVSSVPSWVLGIILVLIFAVGLHLLPPSGIYDTTPPQTLWERFYMTIKHMILPVLAIFLSLFFQSLYSWKTFFLMYAREDYVDLAKAKGLSNKLLEQRYILRPTLPYIITNFALLLVSFWQMTIALEYIFNWPGIGRLYILALPNFHGEHIFPGVMPIVVGIVVIFAYLLGLTVLVLDVIYALVDPRVRLGTEQPTVRPVASKQGLGTRFRQRSRDRALIKRGLPQRDKDEQVEPARAKPSILDRLKNGSKNLTAIKRMVNEIKHYPTALFGLAVILLLVGGSIYAVVAFPYNQLGNLWSSSTLTGKSYIPKLAQPIWVNWFRSDPLPSSIILDSSKGMAEKTIQAADANGVGHITLTYLLDYPYGEYPQEMKLYFTSQYELKRPYVTMDWATPDGRHIKFGNFSPSNSIPFDLALDLSPSQILPDYPQWQKWFVTDGYKATPDNYLLFSDPAQDQSKTLPGTYTLTINVTTFEAGTDVDAEMVVLGQVYGWAGTDYLRRDLMVPLLWGMPFALALGLVGASLTTLFSMILAAAGVWFGGWLDGLIQRLIEGIMILPVIAIGVILYAYFQMNIWTFLALIALLNVFGSPTKSFRAILLQVKDVPYIEAARASGASNARIILHYLLPNVLPVLIPQLVALIPSYVFLEATLGIFGVKSDYPTWGKVIYDALVHGAAYGSGYWVLEPISLLLLTGLAFAMLGFALERILNPRLQDA
jgi:peptide/nickel transport system permease protein